MSKKMMRRSLVLGALMAFVITGSAWADALPSDGSVVQSGNYEVTDNITINGNYQTMVGIAGSRPGVLEDEKRVNITVDKDKTLSIITSGPNIASDVLGVIANTSINFNDDGNNGLVGNKNGTIFLESNGSANVAVLGHRSQDRIAADTIILRGNCGDAYALYSDQSTDVHELIANKIDIYAKARAVYQNGGSTSMTASEIIITSDRSWENNTDWALTINSASAEIGINTDKLVLNGGIDMSAGSMRLCDSNGTENIDTIQITGDVKATSGSLTGLSLSGSDSFITGAINTKDNTNNAVVSFSDGATWNVTGASEVADFDGDGGIIAVSEEILGTAGAINIFNNLSTGTVVKARDLNLSGGAKEALTGLEEKLKNTVLYSNGDEFTYEASAVDVALRGDVELDNEGKVITTMDTDDLVVNGDVKANSINGVKIEEWAKSDDVDTKLESKADASDVAAALAVKADSATTLEGYGITNAYNSDKVDELLEGKADKSYVDNKFATIDSVYTKKEVNDKLELKADKTYVDNLIYGVSDSMNSALADKANINDVYAKVDNITITDEGITVGGNSTHMGENGFYAGRQDIRQAHTYENAKAALSDNGSIKGASGKFIVDGATGNLSISNGTESIFGIDAATGNVTAKGNVYVGGNLVVGNNFAVDSESGNVKANALEATVDVFANGISLVQTATKAEENKQAIATEKTEREAADAKLEDKIGAETEERKAEDLKLQEQINNIDGGNSAAINGINQRLDRTNAKINKVGAGAAALAALHPLDYDPDDKLNFSVGMGNYAGENAAALGAFYRPNEKFMVSLGGTMGNGENMVNLGLSIGLDKASGIAKMSKKELIQKVNAMEAENESMKAEMAELKALVAELVSRK